MDLDLDWEGALQIDFGMLVITTELVISKVSVLFLNLVRPGYPPLSGIWMLLSF